jgi:hypothetical protein
MGGMSWAPVAAAAGMAARSGRAPGEAAQMEARSGSACDLRTGRGHQDLCSVDRRARDARHVKLGTGPAPRTWSTGQNHRSSAVDRHGPTCGLRFACRSTHGSHVPGASRPLVDPWCGRARPLAAHGCRGSDEPMPARRRHNPLRPPAWGLRGSIGEVRGVVRMCGRMPRLCRAAVDAGPKMCTSGSTHGRDGARRPGAASAERAWAWRSRLVITSRRHARPGDAWRGVRGAGVGLAEPAGHHEPAPCAPRDAEREQPWVRPACVAGRTGTGCAASRNASQRSPGDHPCFRRSFPPARPCSPARS